MSGLLRRSPVLRQGVLKLWCCALPTCGRLRISPAKALRYPKNADMPRMMEFPPPGLRPCCGNGRCRTAEWKWGDEFFTAVALMRKRLVELGV